MNIVIIGMSGAGKSTLGVLLAKALGMEFIDTDIIIQRAEGRLLQDIIDKEGIDSFLDKEEKIILGLELENCVVATGGSVVYSEIAMRKLKQDSKILYLHVPYQEIEKRLKNITSRGIVIRKGSTLQDVYNERLPLYIRHSDRTIDCSNKDIEECVNEIVKSSL